MSNALDQFDMFEHHARGGDPERPGHRGIDTSVEAAEGIQPQLGRLQRLTFDMIAVAGWHGCTAHELAYLTGLPREAIQPRTSELRKQGRIVDSRRRRENLNGKRVIVWTLPEFRSVAHG